MTNPYVFVVGCPRSGTTLLERMVNAHPQLAVTKESRWFDKRWITEWFEDPVTPQLLARMLEHPRFGRLRISPGQLLALAPAGRRVGFAAFVSGIFDLYGQAVGKARVGNKTPVYVRSIDLLHSLWPRARFVHLIRDGRDVGLSVVRWPKGPIVKNSFVTASDHGVSTVALWWESHVRLGRAAGRRLGPGLYYEIRYEALVERPREECARLCAFLELPYEDAMLRYHEGRTVQPVPPGTDAKDAWLPVTAGLRDWRSQMAHADLERFEAASDRLLRELAYPVAAAARPESLREASRIRERLARDPHWIELFGADPWPA